MRNALPIFVLALSLGSAALAQTPLRGDAEAGRSLFRMECAACHASDAKGSAAWRGAHPEKPLPDLVDTAFLVTRSDEALHAAIATGHVEDRWIRGHAFPNLSALDRWNIVQWLRDQSLAVEDFFPRAAKFTAKAFEIDALGAARLKPFGVGPEDLRVVVLTAYEGERKRNEALRLIPWTPVELDLLNADDRLGHLTFLDVEVPRSGEILHVGFAFDLEGKITAIRARHADPQKRAAYEKALRAFVGQGLKVATELSAPRGVPNGAAWAKALSRAASLSAEAILMYEKGERARTAFDL